MTKVILDASALLAFIKNEPGAEIIEELLGHIIMSSLSVSEVAEKLLDAGMSLQECQQCILPFISQLIPFDQEQAFNTAQLKKQIKDLNLSLSLEHRACIALGIQKQLPIYTAHKSWKEIQIEGAEVRVVGY